MKSLYKNYMALLTGLMISAGSLFAQPGAPGGGAPANDLCSGAIAVACNDVVTGTTVGATATGAPANVSEGVWYVLTGNDQLVTVATCGSTSGFDTEIAVFTGDCNNRITVGGDDDGCLPYSTLTFEAWSGLDYYIYVGDWSTSTTNTNAGVFQLSVTCAALPVPGNDLCGSATAMLCGEGFIGSTAGATATGELACANGDPGVWYSFVGDGSSYTISTDGSGFDTYLAVSQTCGGTCVASNDDISFPSNLSAEITGFATVVGQTYYIYVSSIWGESGTYVLSLTSNICTPPVNDLCADAISIGCGQTLTGTTVNAGASDRPNTGVSEGVWYVFAGTGQDVTVSTCTTTSGFDTEIVVVSGSCGAFTAVASNDDGCSPYSTLTFTSTVGVDYYIYVADWSGTIGGTNEGVFDLSVTCAGVVPPPANDLCADATFLACGDVVSGSTLNATEQNVPTTGGTVGQGVWYFFGGTGGDVTLSTCNNTDFDSEINVLTTNDCVSFVNIAGNDDGANCTGLESEVTFTTTVGETYFVYVSDYITGGVGGNFDLSFTCAPPANDNVCNATPLVFGTNGPVYTAAATAQVGEPVPPVGSGGGFEAGCESVDGWCSGNLVIENSVWFSFVAPASGSVTLSTDNSYDTQLAVYEAASCSAVLSGGATLVGANDDNPNSPTTLFSSELSISCLTPGQTYYVQVDGYAGTSGALFVELTDNGGVAVSAVVSGGGLSCDGADVDIFVDFTGTGPWTIDVAADGFYVGTFTDLPTPVGFTSTDAATFTVTSVTDQGTGCTAVGTGSAVVTVGETPVADFTAVQTPGTLDVVFTDASTGTPTSWTWDFNGDAIADASTQNVTYTFPGPGVYTSVLIVTNACGTDQLISQVTVVPVNDLCGNAIDVACDDVVSGDFLYATADNADGCLSDVGPGVWYHFVGTGDDVTVSTCGSTTDTELSIHEGACGSLTCVGGNDDACGLQSEFVFASTLGTDYYIFVGYWSATTAPTEGAFDLSITCTPPPTAPVNDDVCSAISLNLGLNGPYSNLAATVEVGEPVPPIGTGTSTCESQDGWCDLENGVDNSVWFSFVAPASGNVTVNTDGGDFDTQIAVYSAASCSAILSGLETLVGANDDNPDYITTIFSSQLVLCGLNAGEVYYIQVDGYNGAEGDVYVTLSEFLTSAFTSSATNLDVAFTDASSSDAGITDWSWDFGDGGTSMLPNPTYSYTAGGTYSVCLTVTDANGCSSTTCEDVTVTDIPTTIAEAVENGMEVYPNPSNGQFVVTIKGVEADVQIIVMDVAGRQVYNEGVTINNSFRKDLNLNVAKGTYVLQVSTLEGVVNRKILID